MKSLPEISIDRPVFAWMLMMALLIFGAISYDRLGISQLPDVDFPVISVSVALNGAAPDIIESQVLDPLEDSLMQIDGIRSINSTAQQSSGNISIEFEFSKNVDQALQDVQNHISQVRNLLPKDLFPPTVRKSNPEDQPILWLVLTHDNPKLPRVDLMRYARDVLYDQFTSVPGVGLINLGGYVDPALRVWADLTKMNHFNLTAEDLTQAIVEGHLEPSVGRLENATTESNIRFRGEAANPSNFGKIMINTRSKLGANFRKLELKDIASIEEGLSDVRKRSYMNGKIAVGLGIVKQHGSNAVQVANDVIAKLNSLKSTLPSGYHLDVRADNTIVIKQSVHTLIFTLLLSALLTSLVCYLFLGSLSSTINVLMAIPTSIIGTFIAIYFFHFTLNTFTLLGLSLAIGIVVDDAIMMLENIVRHRELGESKKNAARKGAKEITFAALAATIAVVAIFLPVVFMKGIIGRFFLQYGLTVSIAVLLSLLEALTLTPMRCSRYLTISHKQNSLADRTNKLFHTLALYYERSLLILLKHRWKTILGSLIFFFLSILVAKKIPGEMMPAQDQSKMLMRFKLPVGTSLDITDVKMKVVQDYLLQQKEVSGMFSVVGGFGGDAVNQGNAFVTLVDKDKRKLSQAELINKFRTELRKQVHGMQVIIQDLSLRGFSASRGFPIEFILQGPNWEKLRDSTNAIMEAMKSSGYVTDINTDVQAGMPELQIHPNRKKLAERGVSLTAITSALNTLVGGKILTGQTEYTKNGHRYPIEIRLIPEQRAKIPDLHSIQVRNNHGETVPLSELVDAEVKPSLMLISRLNRSRAITVYGNPAPGHSQQDALKHTEALAKSMLPPGYSYKTTGNAQGFQESIQSLVFALVLGILVSYMVLASQFNSFVHPITVLMALPFSISGAFIGLAIGHQSINMYSLIGFILLMGIVKKNSILLVDFTNQVRAEGYDVNNALLKACPVRLRPILMTSLATVAGALPEALSIGSGSETMVPMATAIIGGVIASTILTLFVVPCVYSLMARLESRPV